MYEFWTLKEGINIIKKNYWEGWNRALSGTKNKNLINIFINNPFGTIFIKPLEASNKAKNVEHIFKLFNRVIEKIAKKPIVQVIREYVSTYKTKNK